MKYYFLILLTLFPSQFRELPSPKNMLIIWNVGQGLWTTMQLSTHCIHIDLGGEKFSSKRSQSCFTQEIFLTHLDQDHISFLPHFKNSACLHSLPPVQEEFYKKNKPQKLKRMSLFPRCENKNNPNLARIFPGPNFRLNNKFKDNDLSSVFILKQKFLIPGDSTLKAEKIWQKNDLSKIEVLILGHHGSATSTGEELLSFLPRLKMTISSSRFAKYHHPSAQVVALLKQKKIPNLRTEDWGSIGIELKYN